MKFSQFFHFHAKGFERFCMSCHVHYEMSVDDGVCLRVPQSDFLSSDVCPLTIVIVDLIVLPPLSDTL